MSSASVSTPVLALEGSYSASSTLASSLNARKLYCARWACSCSSLYTDTYRSSYSSWMASSLSDSILHSSNFVPTLFYLTSSASFGVTPLARKKYGALDFLAAVCMSTGLAAFVLADSQISPSFSILGVCLISFALLMDACIGNVQEKAMKSYSASDVEIIFFSYSFGAVWLLTSLLVSGQLSCAVNFCHEHPVETYGYGLVYSLTGYFGVQLVLTLVHIAGAFVAAVITTGRKVVTVTLSFVLFSKPFSIHYVWSGLLVLLGVYLHSIHKMHSKKKPVLASTKGSSNV
ncbi:adenosine 3'-phospho 5'-phosphosulfate transporter 2-like isoform X4 [Ornithodoros turicata]|uniref:adenosine 3'-phospho 5'-phosphosulfate transporter 2-like isoform X4 n=1 Tax=Ornithodoros turicata TaxID=34597 RepID=UPI0031392782